MTKPNTDGIPGPDKIPVAPPTPKEQQVAKLNEMSETLQKAVFDLTEFNGLDAGGTCKSRLLDAIDELGTIRRKLLADDEQPKTNTDA